MPKARTKRKTKRRPKPRRVTERIEARIPADMRKKLEELLLETGDSASTYLRRLIIKDLKDQGYW